MRLIYTLLPLMIIVGVTNLILIGSFELDVLHAIGVI